MLYTLYKDSIYYFPCTLMAERKDEFSHLDGISSWNKENAKLKEHKNSEGTDNSCLTCASDVLLEPPSVDPLKGSAGNEQLTAEISSTA